MTWYNPTTWGSKQQSEQSEPTGETENEAPEFTTDLSAYRRMKQAALSAWISDNLFQKTSDDIKPVDADGMAMDSSVAMDESSIKGAFSLTANNLPQVLFSWYVQQSFIGYQACSIIAQHWLVDKACSVAAKDANKKGYELTVNDGSDVDSEIIKAMRLADDRFKIKDNLIGFEKFGRVFGVRIAIFKVESGDPDYYLKPFNIDGVTAGAYKGIVQVDPYWITPELDGISTTDPASINFYEPTWWRVNGKRYHRSHLVINRFSEVSDVLKPTYLYGGLPLPQLIYERIYSAERTANEAPLLALTKRTNILKTNTAKALLNQEKFEERLGIFNHFRDNHGVFAIDKDEDYQQTDTALGDLDNTIMTQYQLVAAIARTPATKLIETSPKGFNATGEYEKESYYDSLECIQDNAYTPLLNRHYELLIRSEIVPEFGVQPFGFDVAWKPLDSPTAKELAEINEINSRTDSQLSMLGAVDAGDVRDRIIADKSSGYNGMPAFYDVDMEPEEEPEEEPEV